MTEFKETNTFQQMNNDLNANSTASITPLQAAMLMQSKQPSGP